LDKTHHEYYGELAVVGLLVAIQTRRASPHCPNVVQTSCYICVRHADRCIAASNEQKIYRHCEARLFRKERGRPIHTGLHIQKWVTCLNPRHTRIRNSGIY
jgi:hypothetical protein